MAGTTSGPLVVGMPRFVGRARELRTLRETVSDAQCLALVEGEAGIGKTRLIKELLSGATDGHVLAACPPLRHPHTLGPLVDAIRRSTPDPGALRLTALAGALRPLLPEWAHLLPPAPAPTQDATAEMHRLFRAIAEWLERLGTRLLVVEDVHWADEATLEFLVFLRAQPVSPVGLVVTSRPAGIPQGSLLRRLSSRHSPGTTITRIALGPLDVAQTSALVSSMMAGLAPSAEFVRFLHTRTDGIPLAVEESVRLLADRADVTWHNGKLVQPDPEKIEVPATIRDAVLERAERLPPHAQAVLRAAAVLDEPASDAVLLAVAGLAPADFAAGLPEALDSGLIAEQARGRAGFRHALASQAVYDATALRARRLMHLRAGRALEGAPSATAGRIARHFREARDTARWLHHAERAADLALSAGDECTADRILHDMVTHGELAGPEMARLTGKISFAWYNTDAEATELAAALRTAIGAVNVTAAEAAAIRLQIARVLQHTDDFDAARVELELAIPGLTAGSMQAAWAMHKLAWPRDRSRPAAEHLRWLRRANATPVSGTRTDRLRLDVERVTALLSLGEQDGWAQAARFLDSDALDQHGYLRAVLSANVGDNAIRWGRYDEARRRLDDAVRICDEHGYERLAGTARIAQAHLHWFTGAWDGLAGRAARFAADDGLMITARAEALVVSSLLAASAGKPDQAREPLRHAQAQFRRLGYGESLMEAAAALSRLSLADGDVTEALMITDESIAVIEAKGIWVWAAEPAPVRVAALTAAGRAAEAAELIAAMRSGLHGRNAPAARAALRGCRATVEQARGNYDRAASAFEQTAQAWDALPRPYDALLAREKRARCLLAAGQREAALALLDEVANGLFLLGASGDADRVFRDLRGHGVAARRPVTGRPGYGEELSPRELDVVRELVAGKSDREIAHALVLSPKTVATHLSSARRKLRVPSRVALAIAAVEAGLITERDQ